MGSSDVQTAGESSLQVPTLLNADVFIDSGEQTVLSEFKPSRRVRTVPGGPHSDIFSHHADEGDALSSAPPKPPSVSM